MSKTKNNIKKYSKIIKLPEIDIKLSNPVIAFNNYLDKLRKGISLNPCKYIDCRNIIKNLLDKVEPEIKNKIRNTDLLKNPCNYIDCGGVTKKLLNKIEPELKNKIKTSELLKKPCKYIDCKNVSKRILKKIEPDIAKTGNNILNKIITFPIKLILFLFIFIMIFSSSIIIFDFVKKQM